MLQLTDKMTATDGKTPLLDPKYRVPSITIYNRLEARPRAVDFERSLRAEVRDALWFLTRQWQMGELQAEDAGSAIDARVITKQLHVDRIALQQQQGRLCNEMIPMETLVEREKVPFTQALKVQAGQYFLSLHTPVLRKKYTPRYLASYSLVPGNESSYRGQIDSLNFYSSTLKRSLDGEKLLSDMAAGSFTSTVVIDAADKAAIAALVLSFQSWYKRQYSQPEQAGDFAWNTQQLSYGFSAAAPSSNKTQLQLRSDDYFGGRLDWYDFDMDPNSRILGIDAPGYTPVIDEALPVSYIPTATTFKGMPSPRFWEMEERQINLGKLNAKTTDHLLLLFAEFSLVYGNDWFVIPYKMPVNTLCEITGLVVTDVFGERTMIQAADAGEENNWQHWSMFNLSNKDSAGSYNRQFYLPSTLTTSLQGEPLEKVNFMRDEMANMVWGVEDIIPDATGKGINGHEAADTTGVKPPPVAASDAKIRYLLGTTVPENWVPFLPVHQPGSDQGIQFQRASMPKLGIPPKDTVKPKGKILTEKAAPFLINEEEIPYSGTIVSRAWQRARWYNGRTFTWIGRHRETGRGEGSSNLAFDQIKPVE